MLILKKIALTGGLSSGKSTVRSLFKENGAYVLDADQIVHQLIETPTIQIQLIELLGPQILDKHGTVERTKIANIVFKDPQKLDDLERLLHPLVRKTVEKEFKIASNEKKWNLFVVEIPLLFETKGEAFFDKTVAVVAPVKMCKERFTQKMHLDEKNYELRTKRQLSQSEKALRADYVIINDGTLDDLKQAFDEIYSKIIK